MTQRVTMQMSIDRARPVFASLFWMSCNRCAPPRGHLVPLGLEKFKCFVRRIGSALRVKERGLERPARIGHRPAHSSLSAWQSRSSSTLSSPGTTATALLVRGPCSS